MGLCHIHLTPEPRSFSDVEAILLLNGLNIRNNIFRHCLNTQLYFLNLLCGRYYMTAEHQLMKTLRCSWKPWLDVSDIFEKQFPFKLKIMFSNCEHILSPYHEFVVNDPPANDGNALTRILKGNRIEKPKAVCDIWLKKHLDAML